jgi:hypothetical protein
MRSTASRCAVLIAPSLAQRIAAEAAKTEQLAEHDSPSAIEQAHEVSRRAAMASAHEQPRVALGEIEGASRDQCSPFACSIASATDTPGSAAHHSASSRRENKIRPPTFL